MKKQKGYIMIGSVIVIIAIVSVMTLTLSYGGLLRRYSGLSYEYKAVSKYLAESCANYILLYISNNPSFAPASGGSLLSLGPDPEKVCKVCEVGAGSNRVFKVRAKFKDAYTNLQINANLTNTSISVTSWGEMPVYNGAACDI